VKLYVDARLVANQSLAGYVNPLPAGAAPDRATRLGLHVDGTMPFAGLIDEVTLFRRGLADGDLVRLMEATTWSR
jgi:hypothetical protein